MKCVPGLCESSLSWYLKYKKQKKDRKRRWKLDAYKTVYSCSRILGLVRESRYFLSAGGNLIRVLCVVKKKVRDVAHIIVVIIIIIIIYLYKLALIFIHVCVRFMPVQWALYAGSMVPAVDSGGKCFRVRVVAESGQTKHEIFHFNIFVVKKKCVDEQRVHYYNLYGTNVKNIRRGNTIYTWESVAFDPGSLYIYNMILSCRKDAFTKTKTKIHTYVNSYPYVITKKKASKECIYTIRSFLTSQSKQKWILFIAYNTYMWYVWIYNRVYFYARI